jgi:rubredoxin
MKCPLCGYQFQEKDGEAACRGCPLAVTCRMTRCPNCGFDIPEEPKLIKAFKAWRRRENGVKGTS